jgi:CubicO group peptidase (beta-lactamase class C family)
VSLADLASRRPPIVPAIHRALRRGVEEEAFPGGAVAVFVRGALVHLSSTGQAQTVPSPVALSDDALFDLASLTKVLATTPAVVVLVARRKLTLDEPVARKLPAFARRRKGAVTVRQLLAHSSGLPAWRPLFLDVQKDSGGRLLFERGSSTAERMQLAGRRGHHLIRAAVEELPLERAPGEAAVYSDLGFLALGFLVEEVTGERLDRFIEREVFGELGLPGLTYRPLRDARASGRAVASTGVCRPREPAPGQEGRVPPPLPGASPDPRPGEVDDDNAFAMGGVAGHAGLFGEARDVAHFGALLIEELAGASRLAPPKVWESFVARDRTAGSTRALGFDTATPSGSSAGAHLGADPRAGTPGARRTIGHTGFTGTSLWIDFGRELSVALLTNRVHPTRANQKIREFRPRFHDEVIEALDLVDAPRA